MLAARYLMPMIALCARQVKTAVQPAHAPVEGRSLARACSIVHRNRRRSRRPTLPSTRLTITGDDYGTRFSFGLAVIFPPANAEHDTRHEAVAK